MAVQQRQEITNFFQYVLSSAPTEFVERVHPLQQGSYKSDKRTDDCGISNDRVEVTNNNWKIIWRQCTEYCKPLGVPLYLDGCDFQTVDQVATIFGGRIRKGKLGKSIGDSLVCTVFGAVNAHITLDTREQPLY